MTKICILVYAHMHLIGLLRAESIVVSVPIVWDGGC
jgi:hypothetical protein